MLSKVILSFRYGIGIAFLMCFTAFGAFAQTPNPLSADIACPDNYGIIIRGTDFAPDASVDVRFQHTPGASDWPIQAEFKGNQLKRWTENGQDFLYFKLEDDVLKGDTLKQELDINGLYFWVVNKPVAGSWNGPVSAKRHAPFTPSKPEGMLTGADQYEVELRGMNFEMDAYVDVRETENTEDPFLDRISLNPSDTRISPSCDARGHTVLRFPVSKPEHRNLLDTTGLYFWVINRSAVGITRHHSDPRRLVRTAPPPPPPPPETQKPLNHPTADIGCPDNYGIIIRGTQFAPDARVDVRTNETRLTSSRTDAEFSGDQLERWTEDGQDFLYLKIENDRLKRELDNDGLYFWVVNDADRGSWSVSPSHAKRTAPLYPLIESLELTGDDRYDVRLTGTEFEFNAVVDTRYQLEDTNIFKPYRQIHRSCEKGKTVLEFPITDPQEQTHLNRDDIGLFFWVINPLAQKWNWKPEPLARAFNVKGSKPLNIFTTDDDFVFDITLKGKTATPVSVRWSVKNYYSEDPIASGTAVINAGTWKTSVNLGRLETNHYRVTVEAQGRTVHENFAVVTPYAKRRQLGDSSPFAMDSAWGLGEMEWKIPWTPALLKPYARAAQLSGVTWVRDRIHWYAVQGNGEKGPDPSDYRRYGFDNVAKTFSSKGIKTLNMLHGTPQWAVSSENREKPRNDIPDNLLDIYYFAKEAGAHFGTMGMMWEILNEPETGRPDPATDVSGIGTGNREGPDKYAAFLKAAAIGFHHSGAPNPLVTVGGLVATPHKGFLPLYTQPLFENGIIDYIDVYNFHNHQGDVLDPKNGPFSFIEWKNDVHLDLKDSLPNAAAMPVWLTEAGGGIRNSPNGLGADIDKQKAQARYWVTSAAISLSTGVDKHFWFAGFPMYESYPDLPAAYWGSFSLMTPSTRNITPYAAYVAQSVMTEALGEAKSLGKLNEKLLPKDASGYVFMDNGDTVFVLWANSDHVSASLNLSAAHGTLTEMMGRKKDISSSGGVFTFPLGLDPVYLRVPGNVYGVTPMTPRKPVPRTLKSNQKIVLDQTFMNRASLTDARESGGYYFVPPNTPTTITVTVYNFNKEPVAGYVTGVLDIEGYDINGYTFVGSGTGTQTQHVNVGAESKAKLTYVVSTKGNVVPAKLTFTGNFNVGPTSPSVSHVKTTLIANELGSPDAWNACNDLNTWSLFPGNHHWEIVGGLAHRTDDPSSPYAYLNDGQHNTVQLRDGVVSTRIKYLGTAANSLTDSEGKNPYYHAGLGVRQKDINGNVWLTEGYLILLRSDGILEIQKGTKGYYPTDEDRARFPHFFALPITPAEKGLKEAELTVAMKGNRFDVFVNGKHALTFYDDGKNPAPHLPAPYPREPYLSAGAVGLTVIRGNAAFSDFKAFAYE